jgi:hypothetical protein
MADIAFSLSADLPPAGVDKLTRDFMRDLDRIGIRAQPTETPVRSGERGVLTAIGQFVINSIFSSKAADSLVDLIKAYLTREKSMSVSVAKADGTKIEINSKNVGSAEVARFLGAAKTVM